MDVTAAAANTATQHAMRILDTDGRVVDGLEFKVNLAEIKPMLRVPLGKGAYGAVYRVAVTPERLQYLSYLADQGSFRQVDRLPAVGDTVAIKVQSYRVSPKSAHRMAIAVREAALHRRLAGIARRGDRVRVSDGCATAGPPPIPAFFMSAGVLGPEGRDGRHEVRILTVMGHVAGKPLNAVAGWTAEVFVAVERALVSLWLAGVAHADVHRGNVMYDPVSGKATIIDFGFGVLLPEATRVELAGLVGAMVERGVKSLGEAWAPVSKGGAGLRRFTNRIQAMRGQDGYGPDNRGLAKMYNRLPAREKKRVPDVRRRAWGCASALPPPEAPAAARTAWQTLQASFGRWMRPPRQESSTRFYTARSARSARSAR